MNVKWCKIRDYATIAILMGFGFFSTVFMSGCEQFMPSSALIRTPTLSFSSMAELQSYIRNNITYKDEWEDRWQAPQETIDKGTGDCEDFCLLAGYFADKLGYRVYLVVVETPRGNHMILELNGDYYEGQTLQRYKYADYYEKIYRIDLENALKQCYIKYGSRSVL